MRRTKTKAKQKQTTTMDICSFVPTSFTHQVVITVHVNNFTAQNAKQRHAHSSLLLNVQRLESKPTFGGEFSKSSVAPRNCRFWDKKWLLVKTAIHHVGGSVMSQAVMTSSWVVHQICIWSPCVHVSLVLPRRHHTCRRICELYVDLRMFGQHSSQSSILLEQQTVTNSTYLSFTCIVHQNCMCFYM